MTPRATRRLRAALLGVVAIVSAAVWWSLRAPEPEPAASAGPEAPADTTTRFEGVVQRAYREGKEAFVLEAERWVGEQEEEIRLERVTLRFPYTAQGLERTATIRSDQALYTPSKQRALFQGDVVLETEDGFVLETDELLYRGDRGHARSERPVKFRRKDISGSSRGLVYEALRGRLLFPAEVVFRMDDPDVPPVEIRAGSAEVVETERFVHFLDGVELTRPGDVVTAGKLRLELTPENQVSRAKFGDGVDLKTSGTQPLPGSGGLPGEDRPRHLTGRQLDLWFGPDRRLDQAMAGPEAELTLLPARGTRQGVERLRSDTLLFEFDELGQLSVLQGLSGSSFVLEPTEPKGGAPRTVGCKSFVARFGERGEVSSIDFRGDVAFEDGPRRATAGNAFFEADELILRAGPVLHDSERDSDLHAQDIYVYVESGDVSARDHVRHVIRGEGLGLPGSAVEAGLRPPTLVSCRVFDFERQSGVLRYAEDVVLRAGEDELRAERLSVERAPDGVRLLAIGNVVSRLSPRGAEGGRLEAEAGRMRYDQPARRITYSDGVTIEQDLLATTSPEAVLTLAEQGGVERLEAGEPAEVRYGLRVANGRRAVYTPRDGTIVLVGDEAVLKDPELEVTGRTLTFRVDDERILVDGQEEVRTRAVIRSGRPPAN